MNFVENINLLNKRNSLLFKFILLILFLHVLTGCTRHWLYIESETSLNSNLLKQPQIIQSKSFGNISKNTNTV